MTAPALVEQVAVRATAVSESVYRQCSPAFGWTVDERASSRRRLVLTRDRRLPHRLELNALQGEFDHAVRRIERYLAFGRRLVRLGGAVVAALGLSLVAMALLVGPVGGGTFVLLAAAGAGLLAVPPLFSSMVVDHLDESMSERVEQEYQRLVVLQADASALSGVAPQLAGAPSASNPRARSR